MPEHSPAPMTHRAIYGFVFYLLFLSIFLVYILWAFLPTDHYGLNNLPDKYFAIFIPMLTLVALSLFSFFIYPSINMSLTPEIDEISSVIDWQLFKSEGGCLETKEKSWQLLRVRNEEDITDVENIENCYYCDRNHKIVHKRPVSNVIFLDLKDINYVLFLNKNNV